MNLRSDTWSVLYRFLGNVHVAGDDECWPWLSEPNSSGYGQFVLRGQHWLAHRYAFAMLKGELVPGLVLDHQCNVKLCQNVARIEQVTSRENTTRWFREQETCARGHVWGKGSTIWRKGSYGQKVRRCKQCEIDVANGLLSRTDLANLELQTERLPL